MTEHVPDRAASPIGAKWWIFLITGSLWMILSLIILRFNTSSMVTIGILVGFMIIAAGVNEIFTGMVTASAWRLLNFALGALFLVIGVIAVFSPGDTFWVTATLIGWFLLFKGIADIVTAVLTRKINDLWWLGLVIGILQILLAFWAAGGFGRGAVLLIAWAAASALGRGITEFLIAFALRATQEGGRTEATGPPIATAPVPHAGTAL